MNKAYDRPTLNMSAIMIDNATTALKDILDLVKPQIGALIADKVYLAIDAGVLTGTPEDFGIVRYAIHLKHDFRANPSWIKLPVAERDQVVKYFDHEAIVQLAINIPALCQLRVTAQVRLDGTVVPETVRSDVEGALGTLWYTDIMKTIESVKAVGLLTAPQLVEKLI